MVIIARAQIVDARPPVMRSRSPSPRTGPSSTIKVVLSLFSPVKLWKVPNSSLVSVGMFPQSECANEATGSFAGPNRQIISSSVSTSTAVNEMHERSGSQP